VVGSSVALVGLPGSGKSTLGHLLARRLGWDFVDSDKYIEEQTGCSITEIFAREAETGFRRRERAALSAICKLRRHVIATGGGAVLLEDNRSLLRQNCLVVYLRAQPDDLFRRLLGDRGRPLLRTADPFKTLCQLFCERDEFYLQTAHLVLDTQRRSKNATVSAIFRELEKHEMGIRSRDT